MIINSGSLKNSRILISKAVRNVRPTSSKIREAVFCMLGPFIEGAVFYDIFCGSGIMGLQAISLGANTSVFVDSNQDLISNIRKYTNKFNVTQKSILICMDAFRFFKSNEFSIHNDGNSFQIAYIDPPYGFERWSKMLLLLDSDDKSFDMILIETNKRLQDYVDKLKKFDIYKHKIYSDKHVFILRKN